MCVSVCLINRLYRPSYEVAQDARSQAIATARLGLELTVNQAVQACLLALVRVWTSQTPHDAPLSLLRA